MLTEFLLAAIFLLLLFCFLLFLKHSLVLSKLSITQENFDNAKKDNLKLRELDTYKSDTISALQNKITKLETQKESVEFAQENMKSQFENLANKIFEKSNAQFKESSFSGIKNILDPLKAKITDFERRVQDSFNSDIKERYSLASHISKMAAQTERMSKETEKLTNTLKGNNKAQGIWGELILAKILECSGLQNGRDYTLQKKLETSLIPDVVINLPEGKHLIIDAKTSLKHYDIYLNTNNQESLDLFIKSVKAHVKNLASKEYHLSNKLFNPGFVFMFIPIESAYSLVSSKDPTLRNFAMQNKIIITSPNSLMAMLQTVSSVWKIVEQNKNAAEIAKKAGGMYDKLVLFLEEFRKIGGAISSAEKSYQEAMNRLKNGSGNLIKRAESLKGMGVTTAKQIKEDLLQ